MYHNKTNHIDADTRVTTRRVVDRAACSVSYVTTVETRGALDQWSLQDRKETHVQAEAERTHKDVVREQEQLREQQRQQELDREKEKVQERERLEKDLKEFNKEEKDRQQTKGERSIERYLKRLERERTRERDYDRGR